MDIEFNLDSVTRIEFGVGLSGTPQLPFVTVPVDAGVKASLRDMVSATWKAMETMTSTPDEYQPSEKYAPEEYVYLSLANVMASRLRELHTARSLPIKSDSLNDPERLTSYFARVYDNQKRHVTAFRRASQFKGMVGRKLIHFISDSLTLVPDKVFKLDRHFDVLVDDSNIHILRPSGFEGVAGVESTVLAAVSQNMDAIQKSIRYVDFSSIRNYASKHPRAARYLASICSQAEARRIDRKALTKLCRKTGVRLTKARKGTIVVSVGHELGFLEVLDRRRYEILLVQRRPEHFKASSRTRLRRR